MIPTLYKFKLHFSCIAIFPVLANSPHAMCSLSHRFPHVYFCKLVLEFYRRILKLLKSSPRQPRITGGVLIAPYAPLNALHSVVGVILIARATKRQGGCNLTIILFINPRRSHSRPGLYSYSLYPFLKSVTESHVSLQIII